MIICTERDRACWAAESVSLSRLPTVAWHGGASDVIDASPAGVVNTKKWWHSVVYTGSRSSSSSLLWYSLKTPAGCLHWCLHDFYLASLHLHYAAATTCTVGSLSRVIRATLTTHQLRSTKHCIQKQRQRVLRFQASHPLTRTDQVFSPWCRFTLIGLSSLHQVLIGCFYLALPEYSQEMHYFDASVGYCGRSMIRWISVYADSLTHAWRVPH